MRKPAVLGAAALGILGLAAAARAADSDPVGTWASEDGRGRIRTEFCGAAADRLCGYVVWMKKPLDDKGHPDVDDQNPDPKKRTRPLLGHQMIMGLALDDGRYRGKIYNADNGKSYDVQIWRADPAALSVKGCLFTLLCSTQSWKRVTDTLPGQLTGATDMPGGPRADHEWAPTPASRAKDHH